MTELDLSGRWQSFYRYPSSGRGNDAMWGRHVLEAIQTDDALHFESVPDSKSHVVIDVTMDESGLASGTWREDTEPDGYYKGAVYEGTIELQPADGGERLNGTWHGKGKNGEMNSDIWELTRNGTEPESETAQN